MCHEFDAVPPAHGPAGAAPAVAGPLTLTSADGSDFGAFLAVPEHPSGVGVVVLPDNRGLSGFYATLCGRLAEQGHTALAPDYFGRTAGAEYRDRAEAFSAPEQLMPHLTRLTPAGLDADITAAADRLRTEGARAIVTLGFCFGGRQAFRTAAPRFGTAGAIGFYGFPGTLEGAPGPTRLAPELTAPVLALWGGADPYIPAEAVAEFDAALTEAGCPHEFVTYPDATHGFFELGAGESRFAATCADAWHRVLNFLAAHAKRPAD
ncbi:dienelactone hydrolase family protein [Embleya scabrispora]|uniref:dienelactone hydrolase family protein n=1 Tax=Embleya scabrispora TaxID=159449 RepID=UPI000367A6DB|nr:dienelactone hydrolase family protein [Embleya scabrispora]MYS81420.1 dienelactone hydrolase family protein [Streptomyces sp. SID5474]